MKFKIYSRKSVFTGKGESIENQVEMCRDYIFANFPGSEECDITVYEDEGFSGKNLDRPQFQRMMRDIKRDKPDCLVCYRLDRISRNVGDFAALIEELGRRGVAFVCIREKFDTGTPMGKAMMYIASVFAQLERETIAERVRDNMLMLAKMGRWLGGTTPTGYTSERVREIIVEGKVKFSCQLKEKPEEIRTVQTIYEKFLELQSLSGVRRYLHEQGLRSRRGEDFSLIGLREILQNPVYCAADQEALNYFTARCADVCFTAEACGRGRGLLAYNKRDYTKGHAPRNPVEKWIVAVGKHRGLICGRDWAVVQELLEANRSGARRVGAHNSYALLSGVIRCTRCGGRMFAKARSGRDEQYDYICRTKLELGRGACSCQNLHGEQADDTVCRCLEAHMRPGPGLERLLEGMRREFAEEEERTPTAAARSRREACGRELDRLVLALGSGGGQDGAFVQRIAARAAELEEELRRLEAAAQKREQRAESGKAEALCAEFLDPAQCTARMSVPEKRALIRRLVQRCEWDGGTLRIFLSATG
ncbi:MULTISPECIES: recombinase family protein [Intestinimonas]|uniref:recombinase family protein n=1 Tax=Intestinimonas TaxID=1392389 RepID=UPI0018AC8315|nr:recombinase family protein [Intestinimonas butyriciproducens]MDB7815775.1 recombinase family protein [Intestinimonas butyriciproducens]MDB7843455.1 recombinase family protein [Intestinimonas butyriciproducens]MDB7856797.1 recombinase family protein [Intestinimonas butyriciproducens]